MRKLLLLALVPALLFPAAAGAEGRLAFYLEDRLDIRPFEPVRYQPFVVEVYANGVTRIDAVAFSMRIVDDWGYDRTEILLTGTSYGPDGRGLDVSAIDGQYVIGLGDCFGLGSQDRVLVARFEFLPIGEQYRGGGRHPCYECFSYLEVAGVPGASPGTGDEPVFSDCSGQLLEFDFVQGPFRYNVISTEASSFGRVKALIGAP